MTTSLDFFISTLDSLMVATEGSELSEISTFINDPSQYLDVSYRQGKFLNPNTTYTNALSSEGIVYKSIIKACNELVKVNAYTEALCIYSAMIDLMTELLPDVEKDDQENLKWSIDEMKSLLIDTMKQRDEYTSKRKSVISKYSVIVEKLQK